jgi:hypothetical protein
MNEDPRAAALRIDAAHTVNADLVALSHRHEVSPISSACAMIGHLYAMLADFDPEAARVWMTLTMDGIETRADEGPDSLAARIAAMERMGHGMQLRYMDAEGRA